MPLRHGRKDFTEPMNQDQDQIQKVPIGQWRVNGLPKGQPRARAFVRGGRAAVYDPGTAEGWKSCIAMACRELEGRGLADPLSVSISFFMPRPKHHFSTSGQIRPNAPKLYHAQKPDADNLAKAMLDALTGIRAWMDDDQVAELTVRKYWESDKNGPQEYPPGASIRIVALVENG